MGTGQQRLILILAAVFLALVAIVVWVEPPEDEGDGGEKAFPDLTRDDIARLELMRAGEPMIFEHQDDGWRMLEPVQAAADDQAVEDMLNRLVFLALDEPIEAADPAPFGLSEDQAVRVVFNTGAGAAHVLSIGAATPVGYGTYTRLDDGPIRKADARIGDDFRKPVDDYRDKHIWHFSPSKVDRVRLGLSTGPDAMAWQELNKDEHGWWFSDGGPRADGDAVESWLRRLEDLRIESFKLPPGQQLEATTVELVVVQEGAEHRLRLAADCEGGIQARIALQDEPVVVELPARELLHLDPTAMRATQALPVRRSTLDRVALVLGDLHWEDARGEDGWGQARTENLLDLLQDTPPGAEERDGVISEPAWGMLTLAETSARTETLLMGPPDAAGVQLARDAAGGPAFLLPQDFSQQLLFLLAEDPPADEEAASD